MPPAISGFARLSGALLDDLLANQPAVLRGDEGEGIHQMRIGIRRLRSLLVLFERFLEPHAATRFSDELRRLGRVLGAARDWDVEYREGKSQGPVSAGHRSQGRCRRRDRASGDQGRACVSNLMKAGAARAADGPSQR